MLKIELVKSTIAALPKQRATVKALGLTKLHQVTILPDNKAVRGIIAKVAHLLKVEETKD